MLEAHPSDAALQEDASYALHKLCERDRYACAQAARCGAVQPLCAAVRTHAGTLGVPQYALVALVSVVSSAPGAAEAAAAGPAGAGIIARLLLSAPQQDEAVMQVASEAFGTVVSQCASTMSSADVLPPLLYVLEKSAHVENSSVRFAFRALDRVMQRCPEHAAEAAKRGASTAVDAAVRAHPDDPLLQRYATSVRAQLARLGTAQAAPDATTARKESGGHAAAASAEAQRQAAAAAAATAREEAERRAAGMADALIAEEEEAARLRAAPPPAAARKRSKKKRGGSGNDGGAAAGDAPDVEQGASGGAADAAAAMAALALDRAGPSAAALRRRRRAETKAARKRAGNAAAGAGGGEAASGGEDDASEAEAEADTSVVQPAEEASSLPETSQPTDAEPAPTAAPLPPPPAATMPAAMRECCVCLGDVPAAELLAVVPCGHQSICADCWESLGPPAARRCPICSAPAVMAMRVFAV